MLDRDALRAELEKAFDERTSTIMLGVLERVAAQTLAAGVQREDFTELKEIVARLGARMDAAAARQDQFEARMERFEARLDELTRLVAELTSEFKSFKQETTDNFARLKGLAKEQFYRERGATIFGLVLRNGKNASSEVAEAVADAVEQAHLSVQEAKDILAADLFWRGEYKKKSLVLVGEISWTVHNEDVERAVRRASRLRSIGYDAYPFVGGEKWIGDASALARALHVLTATDGSMDLESYHQVFGEEQVQTPLS